MSILKRVEINGRELCYVEQGKGQPPLVFVHGALDDYRCWQFQMDYFSTESRSISYSRRFAYPNKWIGDVAQDNTIEANARDLADLVRKLDLAPAHLIGASYGAFIALYCASKNPGLAKTLILNEPPILDFLSSSPSKEDLGLLEQFRNRVHGPTQNASEAGDFRKAAQVAIDGIMEIENFFAKLPEDGKQFLLDNSRSL
jgi:non-heme chloroperoxidase